MEHRVLTGGDESSLRYGVLTTGTVLYPRPEDSDEEEVAATGRLVSLKNKIQQMEFRRSVSESSESLEGLESNKETSEAEMSEINEVVKPSELHRLPTDSLQHQSEGSDSEMGPGHKALPDIYVRRFSDLVDVNNSGEETEIEEKFQRLAEPYLKYRSQSQNWNHIFSTRMRSIN
nr:uncharacterized protein LOC128700553 [Cherax quadricarinatus]